jgi:hypothetical protein
LTETPKRPRSEGNTPIETARPLNRHRDSSGPGYYKQTLTNIKIAIFKETYPEDKLTEHGQESILEELGRVLRGTPIGELPHRKSYRVEGGDLIYIYIYAPTNIWSMALKSYHQTRPFSATRPALTQFNCFPLQFMHHKLLHSQFVGVMERPYINLLTA